MSVPLSSLLTELPEKTRNSTTGSLDNSKRTRAINRILQDLQDYADWDFTKRTKQFDFIDGVNEYSLQNYVDCTMQDNDGTTERLDYKNPYDLRLKDWSGVPFIYKDSKEVKSAIGRSRSDYTYGVDNGVLVVNYPRKTSAQLHNCDSLTANGTVAAGGDATNLTIDDVEYEEGNGSLNFDVSAGTSLIISFTGITAKDLSTIFNKSYVVLKAWLPTITNFTSIAVRIGNDSSNYVEKTETVPAGSTSLIAGLNTFAFKIADGTTTGTVDETAIDYIRIAITYSGATTDTDFRIDDIRVGEGTKMELEYYSLAMVKDTAGDYQLEFNADSITQTDVLVDLTPRRCIVQGATYECFEMIGGKSERDRTDSRKIYDEKKAELLKRCGHRLRRPSKVFNFKR
jgi:hypothetical protein